MCFCNKNRSLSFQIRNFPVWSFFSDVFTKCVDPEISVFADPKFSNLAVLQGCFYQVCWPKDSCPFKSLVFKLDGLRQYILTHKIMICDSLVRLFFGNVFTNCLDALLLFGLSEFTSTCAHRYKLWQTNQIFDTNAITHTKLSKLNLRSTYQFELALQLQNSNAIQFYQNL